MNGGLGLLSGGLGILAAPCAVGHSDTWLTATKPF